MINLVHQKLEQQNGDKQSGGQVLQQTFGNMVKPVLWILLMKLNRLIGMVDSIRLNLSLL
jgi:hypothetical protein